MRSLTTETTDPTRWLDELESETDGMSRLVEESGDLAIAAFRLARARNAGRHPSHGAVTNVARELAARTGYYDVLPSRSFMAHAMSEAGLLI
jgi:hypothetical protein